MDNRSELFVAAAAQSATAARMLRTPAMRMAWSVPVAIMLKPKALYSLAKAASAAI